MSLLQRITAILERARVAGGWIDEDVARDVLRAIREPGEALLGIGEERYMRDEDHMSTFHCLSVAWTAMIDAALNDEGEPVGADAPPIDLPEAAAPTPDTDEQRD